MSAETLVVRDEWPARSSGPTAKQQEFWAACAERGAEEILFSGSIRGGKTQAAAKQIVAWAWRYPGTYLVMRRTYRELADSTQKAILRGDGNMPPALPPQLIRGGSLEKGYRAKDEIVYLANGAEIIFRSCEDALATIDKIKNITLGGFLIDQVEELESDRYFELYQTMVGRLSHPGTPRKGLLVANPASESHWVYRRFVDPVRRKDYTRYVHVTLFDNEENLPDNYVRSLQRREHEDKHWYDRYVLGKWGAFGGKRFKIWDPAIHVVEPFGPIPQEWEIVEAIDYGYKHATCCLWLAIDFEGRWWVIGEHYERERPVSYHARAIKNTRTALNISPSSIWLDPSAWALRGEYEAPAMEFFDYGIVAAKAQNDRLGGWNRIDELLTEKMPRDDLPRLRIFNSCQNLIRELPALRIKDGTDDVEKEDDHAPDALRYAVMSRAPAPLRPEEEEESDWSDEYARSLVARMRARQEHVYLGG
jgi:PBSX family phage terminase large subunit